jgi:hypothetical protein
MDSNSKQSLPECDLLQDLFNSDPTVDKWVGWYDSFASKSDYYLIDVWFGMLLDAACGTLASDNQTEATNSSYWQTVQSKYEADLNILIDRVLAYMDYAKNRIDLTLPINL